MKNMTIVTPSVWLSDLVQASFLNAYPVKVIPNGINLQVFRPLGTANQTAQVKNILGAANVWSERKGLSAFLKLADMLDDSYHITLVGLNRRQQLSIRKQFPDKITALQKTQDLNELVELYNNAYVFVNPTLEDNFPTTNLEALACGTPVITYRTGGSPEALDSGCGIVVEKGNVPELFHAICSLPNHGVTHTACRTRALKYDKDSCFKEYISLYHDILFKSSDELP